MKEKSLNHSEPLPSVDLIHAVVWIAQALDYVGVEDVHHSQRVAYIAFECSKLLGWDVKQQEFVFLAGLLHDCGVCKPTEQINIPSRLSPNYDQLHCRAGFKSLNRSNILAKFAPIILHHHTYWIELKKTSLSPLDKDVAALIFIADTLDSLRTDSISSDNPDSVILRKREIIAVLKSEAGTVFKPSHVDALCELVDKDGFWFAMNSEYIETIPFSFSHLEWLEESLSLQDLIQFGLFVAGIVDAKSTFTYQHSLKVAELCFYIANGMSLPKHTSTMLYVAGLIHDIGKLRTPDEILHKAGKLTSDEYICVRRHTFDTKVATSMIFPCSKIGEWASNHHEKLNGSGYPFNKTSDDLDLPSRIITIADIFQALSQKRPYRESLKPNEILDVMRKMVENNELDSNVYRYLETHVEECYEISVNENMENNLLNYDTL